MQRLWTRGRRPCWRPPRPLIRASCSRRSAAAEHPDKDDDVMLNRSKMWAVTLLAAVFAAGALSGWAVQAAADRAPPRPRRGPDAMVNHLTEELTLTPAQQESVRAVFTRHRGEMDAIWPTVRPRMDSLRAVRHGEILGQLTEEQRARFEAMDEHRHRSDSTRRATEDRK